MPVIVCVPARNEERALPGLFAALAAVARSNGGGDPLTLCLYLDGCEDGSAAWVDAVRGDMPFGVLVERGGRAPAPNAGAARRAAMAMGLAHLGGRDGLLLTTDADSRPRPDWSSAGRIALDQAEFVAGRILRQEARNPMLADAAQSRVERYYDRLHGWRRTLDPVPWEARDSHHCGGGANLAMRASAYRAVGGFRPLPFAEDATLLDDAGRAGFRVRRDAALLVETSSRRHGRAAQGLATTLRALDDGRVPRLANPASLAWQWRLHALARTAFATIDRCPTRVELGAALGLGADHVLGVARDCPNAEAFAMRIVPAPPARPDVTLAEAEEALAMLEADWCEAAA